MKQFDIVWIIWLILVIAWNFGVPNALPIAAPIPRLEPVTIIILPLKFIRYDHFPLTLIWFWNEVGFNHARNINLRFN